MNNNSRTPVVIRCSLVSLAALLSLLLSVAAGAATPQLLRNINTTAIPQDSYPQVLGQFNGRTIFGARDNVGPGLWATDGTNAGTRLLKRLAGIGAMFSPELLNLVTLGPRALFVADDGATGLEVWTTDGTTVGTKLLLDAVPGANGGFPHLLGVVSGRLIYLETDALGNRQLFSTDGTTAGTQQLTAFTGNNAGALYEISKVDAKFYFVAIDDSYSRTIWVSNGTPSGTHQIVTGLDNSTAGNVAARYNPHSFRRVGNRILYASSGLLWSLDIASDTVSAVVSAIGMPGFGPPQILESADIVPMDGFVLFIGTGQPAFGDLELWRSDGTPAGTYVVAVVVSANPTFNEIQYPVFLKVGNRAVYVGDDGVHGPQLWSSDGTPGNTFMLTNATQPANSFLPIAAPKGTFAGIGYFVISDGADTTTWSVWQTDGTLPGTLRIPGLPGIPEGETTVISMAGKASTVFMALPVGFPSYSLYTYQPATQRVTNLRNGLNIDYFTGLNFDGQKLLFGVRDPLIGLEPWISDGTASGTRLLADLYAQTSDAGSDPSGFAAFGDRLAFVADDGSHGRELWTSDGTASGTTLLADIAPGAPGSNPTNLVGVGNSLYFFAPDASGISSLAVMTRNSSSPVWLTQLSPQSTGYFSSCFNSRAAVLRGKVYFSATDGISGYELWVSDGTKAGTRLVADIAPGAGSANPCELTVMGNRIYFSAAGRDGVELWVTDGTASGTREVRDIARGAASSSPSGLTSVGEWLYFRADDGRHGVEPWRSHGSREGTGLVADVVPGAGSSYGTAVGALRDKVLLLAYFYDSQTYSYETQLWTINGTSRGATRVGTVTVGGTGDVRIVGANAVFFSDGPTGPEPWVTDGTNAGTKMLMDINSSPGSYIGWTDKFGSPVLFDVVDAVLGDQLWQTNGTARGTVLVGTMPPLPAMQFPPDLAVRRMALGRTFFFAANDPAFGAELFVYSPGSSFASVDIASADVATALMVNSPGVDGQAATADASAQANSDVTITGSRGGAGASRLWEIFLMFGVIAWQQGRRISACVQMQPVARRS